MLRTILGSLALAAIGLCACFGAESELVRAFAGQDVRLSADKVVSWSGDGGVQVLQFAGGFNLSLGSGEWSSESAVVWVRRTEEVTRGRVDRWFDVRVYMEGEVESKRSGLGRWTGPTASKIGEDSLELNFDASGQIYVSADERVMTDLSDGELYQRGAGVEVEEGRAFYVQPEAEVPVVESEGVEEIVEEEAAEAVGEVASAVGEGEGVDEADEEPLLSMAYPIHWRPLGQEPLDLESAPVGDGLQALTVTEPIYVWQKIDEEGGIREFRADSAVLYFRTGSEAEKASEAGRSSGNAVAVYLGGNVTVTEGLRSIKASELYFDFEKDEALILDAEMRTFDIERGIPIYVRAEKLRQISKNRFEASNVVLTSSEFTRPQLSAEIGHLTLTDESAMKGPGEVEDEDYRVKAEDFRLKWGETTVFYLPEMQSTMASSDLPIRRVRAGYGSVWGASVETEWYLSRLLGVAEPAGTESSLLLDYYGKRGPGAGLELEYQREDYFGSLLGYMINDHGEDRLGRAEGRKDVEPTTDLRGRFAWKHRQQLPYQWQFTGEVDYISDDNFIESFFRNEFNAGKERETYAHLQRIEDNWAVSLLGKGQINYWAYKLEELPSVEYHLQGESLWDDRLTLYNDTQVSRLQQRVGSTDVVISEDDFAFVSQRTELDMPLQLDSWQLVPYAAGTFGFDDRSGFNRNLVDGVASGDAGSYEAWIGELGLRVGTQFWKVYPDVKSETWDLTGLRHVVEPEATAILFDESNEFTKQRDVLNLAVSQRLQTKRGPAGEQRTVDWLRVKSEITWVDDSVGSEDAAANRFVWNTPYTPLSVFSHPDIFNNDLDSVYWRTEDFGVKRNYFGTEAIMRLGDTTAISGDIYYDLENGTFQQVDVGISRLVWPNLSYYIGSRYLRNVRILDEVGSNTFTFSATYVIDPRYTFVFTQQFDFDYGANNRSDLTLIRRYHRIYYSLTYSFDGSLDSQAIVFSIWPQGVPELALGDRSYIDIGGSAGY